MYYISPRKPCDKSHIHAILTAEDKALSKRVDFSIFKKTLNFFVPKAITSPLTPGISHISELAGATATGATLGHTREAAFGQAAFVCCQRLQCSLGPAAACI